MKLVNGGVMRRIYYPPQNNASLILLSLLILDLWLLCLACDQKPVSDRSLLGPDYVYQGYIQGQELSK